MKTFHLEILTPEKPFFIGECVSLMIPISDGMLGIMAGHTPLTAAIHNGCVSYTLEDGTKKDCAVSRGMLNVDARGARLLCDYAVLPENINEEQERMDIAEAEIALREKQSHEDYVTSQITLAKAFSNLRIKKHSLENGEEHTGYMYLTDMDN